MSTKFLSGLSWLRIEGGAGGCVKKGLQIQKKLLSVILVIYLGTNSVQKKVTKQANLTIMYLLRFM